jgi:hypothetical protein
LGAPCNATDDLQTQTAVAERRAKADILVFEGKAVKTESLSSCPVCSEGDVRPILHVRDFETGTGKYGISSCMACGLAFTNPRPVESEIPSLYESRTSSDFPRLSSIVARLRDLSIDWYLRDRLPDSARVLDFGCGDGALCRAVQRIGHEVTGVDFHDTAPPGVAEYVPYTKWRTSEEKYTAVFLRHVLEHHPEPPRLLSELRRVLLPHGKLFIEVPNRVSMWARVFGEYYYSYYVPRHYMHFDPKSLRTTIERSGLRCQMLTLGHTPIIGSSLGYLLGKRLTNLGIVGMATFPLQVLLDLLTGRSTTLRVTATL